MATEVKNGEAFANFIKEMKKAKGAYVAIGLHEDAGEYESGVTVVEVGLWNEFGTKNTPERAWMRSTIDENAGKLNALRDDLLGKIHEGNMTVKKALEIMGFRIQTLLQNKIKSNMSPANSPETLKHKSEIGVEQRTLMESKLMLRSVTYKVFGA